MSDNEVQDILRLLHSQPSSSSPSAKPHTSTGQTMTSASETSSYTLTEDEIAALKAHAVAAKANAYCTPPSSPDPHSFPLSPFALSLLIKTDLCSNRSILQIPRRFLPSPLYRRHRNRLQRRERGVSGRNVRGALCDFDCRCTSPLCTYVPCSPHFPPLRPLVFCAAC